MNIEVAKRCTANQSIVRNIVVFQENTSVSLSSILSKCCKKKIRNGLQCEVAGNIIKRDIAYKMEEPGHIEDLAESCYLQGADIVKGEQVEHKIKFT